MGDMTAANAAVSRKNSILELLRFLFAMWVLYYHGFVPYKCELFSDGFLAVEFFFVLSGFFLVRSVDKYTALPTKIGITGFLRHRFSSIAVPFLIGEVFVLIYSLRHPISVNFLFGYLWYVRDLFIAMTAVFLLRRFVKNERIFYLILTAVSIIAMFGFRWIPMMAWPSGPFRSAVAMPLGMLAARIPKITVKNKRMNTALYTVGFFAVGIGCLAMIASPDKSELIKHILVILGYPMLIYFASRVDFNFSLFNWLGTLSFPIYAFQCILRVIEELWIIDEGWLFIILMGIVLLYSLIIHLISLYKKRYVGERVKFSQ